MLQHLGEGVPGDRGAGGADAHPPTLARTRPSATRRNPRRSAASSSTPPQNASPAPLLTNWFEVEAVLNTALEGIVTGKPGVRDAVAEAKRQAEPLLAAARSFGT